MCGDHRRLSRQRNLWQAFYTQGSAAVTLSPTHLPHTCTHASHTRTHPLPLTLTPYSLKSLIIGMIYRNDDGAWVVRNVHKPAEGANWNDCLSEVGQSLVGRGGAKTKRRL